MSYTAQCKLKSPNHSWQNLGSFGSENGAITAAMRKKAQGAVMVRVIDKNGHVVFCT